MGERKRGWRAKGCRVHRAQERGVMESLTPPPGPSLQRRCGRSHPLPAAPTCCLEARGFPDMNLIFMYRFYDSF